MKIILLFIILTCSINLSAQSEKYVGKYEANFNINNEGTIEYILSLKLDGTFIFHFYRQLDPSQPKENKYGKGTWKVEKNNTLYFYTNNSTDLDDKHILDFTNSKARYYTKSPRDKTDKIVKNNLRFYDSEIFWVKGMKLFKK